MPERPVPAPAERIRRYLDEHGGSVEVPVHDLLTTWRLGRLGADERERIERELRDSGIATEPALAALETDSLVILRVASVADETPSDAGDARRRRRAVAPAGDRTIATALVLGAIGLGLGLGPARLYGFALALGALAVTFGVTGHRSASREPRAGGARGAAFAALLGIAALGLGIHGSLTLDVDNAPQATNGERARFCSSEKADELARASASGANGPDALHRATVRVLDAAEDAPSGSECAVSALDDLAEEWNTFGTEPGYEDADDELRRIRDFQHEHGLRVPVF